MTERTTSERPHWLSDWALDNFDFSRNVNHQTVVIEANIRRNAQCPDELIESIGEEYITAGDFLEKSASACPNNRCLGVKNGESYKWTTYEEVMETCNAVAEALLRHGLVAGDKIGIFAFNSPHHVELLQASYMTSMVNVAVYPTFGDEELCHVVNDSEMKILFVAKKQCQKVNELLSRFKSLKTIVTLDGKSKVANLPKGMETIEWSSFMQKKPGKATRQKPTPDDIACLLYTSGSTGMPKGVILTHRNMAASIGAAVLQFQPSDGTYLHSDYVYFSYLPLAHSFERIAMSVIFTLGAAVGFFSGDTKKISEDARALRPTWMPCAPRVFDKVYTATMEKLQEENFIKRAIFNVAYLAQYYSITWLGGRSAVLDSLVFNQIKEKLGGRLTRILSGGSPLSQQTFDFIRIAITDTGIQQGYGLTETAAATCFTYPEDHQLSVGAPCPSVEIKLVACKESEEMKKEKKNAELDYGEIYIRGPSVFVGYNNQKEKFKEDVNEEGWFKTGDIGVWNENGTLNVVDRRKNYLKLSQGEFVSPEKLEDVYSKCDMVERIFIAADPSWSALLAVVKVKDGNICSGKKGENSYEDEETRKKVVDALAQTASSAGLKGFEKIADVVLTEDDWTPENELATPTMKVKRPALMGRYKTELEEMAKKQK